MELFLCLVLLSFCLIFIVCVCVLFISNNCWILVIIILFLKVERKKWMMKKKWLLYQNLFRWVIDKEERTNQQQRIWLKVDSSQSEIQLKVAVIKLDNESPECPSSRKGHRRGSKERNSVGAREVGVREEHTEGYTNGLLADSTRLASWLSFSATLRENIMTSLLQTPPSEFSTPGYPLYSHPRAPFPTLLTSSSSSLRGSEP